MLDLPQQGRVKRLWSRLGSEAPIAEVVLGCDLCRLVYELALSSCWRSVDSEPSEPGEKGRGEKPVHGAVYGFGGWRVSQALVRAVHYTAATMHTPALDQYQTVTFTREGRILQATLVGSPPVNGVTEQMHHELATLFFDLQRDPGSDLIVLTGQGRAFCAGGDMAFFQKMIDDPRVLRDMLPDAKRIIHGLLDLEKPIVCRMNGSAAGLGATLALLCDIIIADETAKIGDPHVKAGLVAGDGGAVIWPQLIGMAKAKELLLTGEMITAKEAADLGLINYAVPRAELDQKVAEITEKLLGNPRWAVRWTKTAMNIPLRGLANQINDAAMAYELLTNLTEDRKEAVKAFLEKRPMHLTGE